MTEALRLAAAAKELGFRLLVGNMCGSSLAAVPFSVAALLLPAGDLSVFGVALPSEDFDTIGGLVAHELGRVPRRGESTTISGLSFSVMLTRGGAVRWFKVTRAGDDAAGADAT